MKPRRSIALLLALTMLAAARPADAAPGGHDIAIDPNGNVVVVGQSRNDFDDSDMLTIEYDANGILLWADVVDGPVGADDSAEAVAVGADGRVATVGFTVEPGFLGRRASVVVYDTDGDLLWSDDYTSNFMGTSGARLDAVVIDAGGQVFAAGSTNNAVDETDIVTLAYDAAGAPLWDAEGGGGTDTAHAIDVAADGTVLVASQNRLDPGFFGGDTTFQLGLTAREGLGGFLFTELYSGSGSGSPIEAAHDLAIDPSGDVWVTGTSCTTEACFLDPHESGPVTLKYAPNGALHWVSRFDTVAGGDGLAIAVDAAGFGHVAGSSDGDYVVLRYDPDGNLVWSTSIGLAGGGVEEATAIVLGSGGEVYVTGESDDDYLTAALDANGALLWSDVYDGPNGTVDRATAIALDGDALYVTGESGGRFATLRYTLDGQRVWVERSGGAGPPLDLPLGIEQPGGGDDPWRWATDLALGAVGRVHSGTGYFDLVSGCLDRRQGLCQEVVGTGPDLVGPRAVALSVDLASLYLLDGEGRDTVVMRVDPDTGARRVVSGCEPGSDCERLVGGGPELRAPQGIAVEPDGSILVTDVQLDAVLRIEPERGDREVVSGCDEARCGLRTVGDGPKLRIPAGLAVEESGDIVVVDVLSRGVLRIDPDSGDRTVLSADSVGDGPTFRLPVDVAIDPDGDLMVLDSDRPTRPGLRAVVRVDAVRGDRRTVSADGVGSGEKLVQPEAIAILKTGTIVVADSGLSAVLEIDPDTGDRTRVSEP